MNAILTFLVLALTGGFAFAQNTNSAFVREMQLEDARARDFRRHEADSEKYEEEREAHLDVYKAKVQRQEERDEVAREAYIVERDRREKGLSDDELDDILKKKTERENEAYEAQRESFVKLRDQIEAAHKQAPLNENEEYGL